MASARFVLRGLTMDNPLNEQIQSLTQQIRSWYEQSPKAQHAYEQLSADVDNVVARVQALVEETEVLRELRDKVAALIDPPTPESASPATPAPPSGETTHEADAPTPLRPTDTATDV